MWTLVRIGDCTSCFGLLCPQRDETSLNAPFFLSMQIECCNKIVFQSTGAYFIIFSRDPTSSPPICLVGEQFELPLLVMLLR